MSQRQRNSQHQSGAPAVTAQAFWENFNCNRGRLVNSMTAITRNREEAEDIAATAFTAAFKNLGAFRGESSLQTWIHAIGRREAIRRQRRSNVVQFESIDDADTPEVGEPDLLAQALERAECGKRIRAAMRRVPLTYRQILVDHFVRGRAIKHVAKTLRIPLGTALSRLFRAKQLLRAAWEA